MNRKIIVWIVLCVCLSGWALAEALPEESDAVQTSAAAAEPVQTSAEVTDAERIRAAQQNLKDLGFLEGKADGVAGKKTAAAVSAFQAQYGLTQTGILDEFTLAAIRNAAPTSVKDVQQRLIDLGYLRDTADGKWGGKSKAAMKLFQQLHDLQATGTADAASVERLFQEDATAMPAGLRSGDSGTAVSKLQKRLIQFGFMADPISGTYGKTTVAAVKEFQQRLIDQGLAQSFEITATGEATPITQLILYNSAYSTYLHDVRAGETADEALRIQRRLVQLGYMDTDAHDTMDDYALQALDMFKARASVLTFGAADQATIDVLFSEDAPTAEHPVWRGITSGDTGRSVSAAEEALVCGGMLVKLPNGKYDSDMVKAVERLHDYLTEQKRDEAPLFADSKNLSGEAVTALYNGLLDYVSDVGAKKSNAAETLRVQRRLYALYYLSREGVDGKAGSQSRDAIKQFQSTNGLEVTGIADQATQEVLFSEDALEKRFPFRIHVRLDSQRVEVYQLNSGNDYDLVQSFVCSTGLHDATPHGVFLDGHPINRWHYFEKFNCWAQYAYEIQGDILFHSVIYRTKNEKSVTRSSISNLGRPASHGCVRLQVEDAKWIYENCKRGSTVILVS